MRQGLRGQMRTSDNERFVMQMVDAYYSVKRLPTIDYFTANLNDTMKNNPGNNASEQPVQLPPISMGKSFYLIIDGCRIGPFLAIGQMGNLRNQLRLRGVRIAV
jgi:hypothetical protein